LFRIPEARRAQFASLADGSERLPHAEDFPMPRPVHCSGGCGETYCSDACEAAAWKRHHLLLCPGGEQNPSQFSAAILEFKEFADEMNDMFHVAAQVVTATVLRAREIEVQLNTNNGIDVNAGSSKCSLDDATHATKARVGTKWEALKTAWEPFQVSGVEYLNYVHAY
jgi:hypothetical protein